MPASNGVSVVLAAALASLLFSAMQLYKTWFAASQLNTIIGGYLGSWLFIFYLTAISNLEVIFLGKSFQSGLFPEVVLCLLGAMAACGAIHRVCTSTCLIFSLVGLYFVNRISQKYHSSPAVVEVSSKKKKK